MPHYHKHLSPIYLLPKLKPLLQTEERWRRVAKILKVSKKARLRLEWIIYSREGHTVALTCRHFGISAKTYYKWAKYFDEDNLYTLYLLEDRSTAPKVTRKTNLTQTQELRIIALRREKMMYGAKKLAAIYQSAYHEYMSEWHIGHRLLKFGNCTQTLKRRIRQQPRGPDRDANLNIN